MNYLKNSIAAISAGVLFSFVAFHVTADEWDKKTVLTTKETIQVPNATLEPGTYVFKLLNSESDRNIVQVFNQDGTHLITTILAIPNYRLTPTGKSEFTFWEVPAGQPPAMRAWFYPGNQFGQEFAYPKNSSAQIASYTKTLVPTTSAQSAEEMKSADVTGTNENGQNSNLDKQTYTPPQPATPVPTPQPQVTEPEPQPTQMAQATPPEPAPAPQTTQPMAQPEPAAIPSELPSTGSQLPLVALLGISLLAVSLVIGGLQRVR